MSVLKSISEQEESNLNRMQRLEDEALSFTANKLSEAVKDAVTNDDEVPAKFMEAYIATYTASMMVSWLLGQVHIIKEVDDAIELSNRPILLAVEPVPFQEAIDALSSMIPTRSDVFRQMAASMKLRAFTIANISSLDAINNVKQMYTQAITDGLSRSEALQNLDSYLESQGISEANPYWLELHYRNNMMTAYNSGRWTQIADNDLVGYLCYVSVMDDGTTELCTELDGVVKIKTDDFWITFYPPNHHKCRATVSVLSKKQYESLPGNIKEKGNKTTESTLYENDTYKKEHQFTSSPIVAMKALPESVAKSAKDYELTNDILKYSYDQSQSLLEEQVKKAKAMTINKSVLNAAVKRQPELEPFREMITHSLPENADTIVYGFDTLSTGEWLPSLQFVLELDDKHRAVALAAAFDDASIYDIKYFEKEELDRLLADFVNLEK